MIQETFVNKQKTYFGSQARVINIANKIGRPQSNLGEKLLLSGWRYTAKKNIYKRTFLPTGFGYINQNNKVKWPETVDFFPYFIYFVLVVLRFVLYGVFCIACVVKDKFQPWLTKLHCFPSRNVLWKLNKLRVPF